ncbi:MAG: hypothetical protein RMY28_019505 [Nostoc sp. ChiSLP01]
MAAFVPFIFIAVCKIRFAAFTIATSQRAFTVSALTDTVKLTEAIATATAKNEFEDFITVKLLNYDSQDVNLESLSHFAGLLKTRHKINRKFLMEFIRLSKAIADNMAHRIRFIIG